MTEHKIKVYKKEYTVITEEKDGEFIAKISSKYCANWKWVDFEIGNCQSEQKAIEEMKRSILEHLTEFRKAEKLSKMTAKERYFTFTMILQKNRRLLMMQK